MKLNRIKDKFNIVKAISLKHSNIQLFQYISSSSIAFSPDDRLTAGMLCLLRLLLRSLFYFISSLVLGWAEAAIGSFFL